MNTRHHPQTMTMEHIIITPSNIHHRSIKLPLRLEDMTIIEMYDIMLLR
jgi:hypothetical protein